MWDPNLFGFSVGIEVDMFSVREPKSTSVLIAGRKIVFYNIRIEIGLIFSVGIEIDLVFVCGPMMACF